MNESAFEFPALVHEIRGRLSSIVMFAGKVKADARRADLAWLDERLARIHRAAVETQRIVDALARIQAGGELERVSVDASSLATRLVQAHIERYPEHGRAMVRIQSNIQITGDMAEVEIVMANLIENAFKFSSRREAPQISITASGPAPVAVHVSDNGVGIAPEDAPRIFEPFSRFHAGFGGSGIGLAIARRIVERHGGRIWATGEPGLGATFSFCL